MKAAVIIPVYNHQDTISRVVRKCLALELPVIVVDDGSTDNTGQQLAAIDGITVCRHKTNQGKGAALLTGFAKARKSGCDYGLTIDGDGQHNPDDAPALLAVAEKEKNRCLVVGVRRDMSGVNVPWTSRFGRGFSNFWVRMAGGPVLRDSQSGFRLYPLPETLRLDVRARRYQYEVEVLVLARLQGLAIKEVEIGVIYQEKGERISHFRPWVDFMRNSATFSRLIFWRVLRSFRP